MRWEGRRESSNVRFGGGGGGRMVVGGGLGVVVIALVSMFLGVDPTQILSGGSGGPGGGTTTESGPQTEEEARQTRFVKVILADTEDVWKEQFRALGRAYEEPRLVIFRGQVESACGFASSAVGPFYCPGDHQVYLDLAFLNELATRFKAPGEFAQAYVIAHEIGHHVQTLLGTTDKMERRLSGGSKTDRNRQSVRLELQADFYAGVWAHHAERMKHFMESGDLEKAIGAAQAVGDDRLQQQARGHVVPDSFTHGSSAQRMAWFRRGFETGDLRKGDTFDDALFDSVSPR